MTSACLPGPHTHRVLVYRPHHCLLSHHSWIHHPGLHSHARLRLLHHRHHSWLLLLAGLHHAGHAHAHARLPHLVETRNHHTRLTGQGRHHVVLLSHHLVLRVLRALHYPLHLNDGLALLLGELADRFQILLQVDVIIVEGLLHDSHGVLE